MKRILGVLGLVLCVAPRLHADVIVVDLWGGGDYVSIATAVAAAADGDTILVHPGLYWEPAMVVIDGKSLTIAGNDIGPGPLQNPSVELQPGLIVRNLPAGKRVVVQNVRLRGPPATPEHTDAALVLRDNVSHVRLQSCQILGGDGTQGLMLTGLAGIHAEGSASVALVGCDVRGGEGATDARLLPTFCGQGGVGIFKLGGQMLVWSSSVVGGDGADDLTGTSYMGGAGGVAINQTFGTLFVAASDVRGGRGGYGWYGGDGGHGLVPGSSGFAWLMAGDKMLGGNGGSGDFQSGKKGFAVFDPAGVVTDYGGGKRGFKVGSPAYAGTAGWLALDAPVEESALVFLSFELHLLPQPGHQGALMLMPTSLLGPFPIGPPGTLQVPFVAPSLGGLETLDVHLQPVYVGGSGAFLGPGRVLTLVD